MKKYLLLASLFIFSLFFLTNLRPVSAQDYDAWCRPQVCWEQFGGVGVYYNQCSDHWGYCAGTGVVAPGYCTCRAGGAGYAGKCTCDLNYDRGDGIGPACITVPKTNGSCLEAKYANGEHVTCTKDSDCKNYGGAGAYADDICVIAAGTDCAVDESARIHGCCYGAEGPPPTSKPLSGTPPPNTPRPSTTPPSGTPPSGTPPTNTPPPNYNATINLRIIKSSDGTLAGGVCSGPTSPLYTDGETAISWEGSTSVPNSGYGATSDGKYAITLYGVLAGETFDLKVWPTGVNFSCSCSQSPVPGEENACLYANVTVPPKANPSKTLYIYFDDANYADSWFQTFGANAFARNKISSIVPSVTCLAITGGLCQPAVFAPRPGLTDGLTSGFPLLGTTNATMLITDLTDPYKNIHWAGKRSPNQDAFGLGLNADSYKLNYDHFYNLANDTSTIIPVTAAQTKLETLKNHASWVGGKTNYFLVNENLTLDQSRNFQVLDGDSLVIFVNGNLTIANNNEADNVKIISVARKTNPTNGGLLAFIVKGDIVIQSDVGKKIDPMATTVTLPVTYANSHLDGVYIANGSITVNSQGNDGQNSAYPDRKLIAAGTFVGLSGINLNRQANEPNNSETNYYKIQNSYQALENFIYRSDLLINWPSELKSSIINWQEVAPKSFNN